MSAQSAKQVGIGQAEFVPSAQRPIGFRGDHTGVFAGAKPPVEWDERTGKGIRWRTTLPGYSISTPIVVADKVFTLADPDMLICLDADSGKILWTGTVLDVIFPDTLKAPDKQAAWREAYNKEYRWGAMSKDTYSDLMRDTAKLLPDNDGLQAFVSGERVRDTKGGGTGQPIPLAHTNRVGARTTEWYWVGNTFSPPVSDGKYVYAMFSLGGTGASDPRNAAGWRPSLRASGIRHPGPGQTKRPEDPRQSNREDTGRSRLAGRLRSWPGLLSVQVGRQRLHPDPGPEPSAARPRLPAHPAGERWQGARPSERPSQARTQAVWPERERLGDG